MSLTLRLYNGVLLDEVQVPFSRMRKPGLGKGNGIVRKERKGIMDRIAVYVVLFTTLLTPLPANADGVWGRLANPGFENTPIKSVFFFTGNWREGIQFYEYDPSPNTGLYTIYPVDTRHLEWSERAANRAFAVDTMIDAGVNVINMSYWGPRGTDNWAYWAPMQTSTYSHDELFDVAISRNILIAPYIETYAPTARSPGFSFRDCFPGSPDNPAPEFVAHVMDLIDRYVLHPKNHRWADQWARVYNRFGEERYLVCVIGVASAQEDVTDRRFAEGFDWVADRIFRDTGVRVGFAIDAMPPDTYLWAPFLPSAETTGPWLWQQSSIIAIQPYFSGHSIGVNEEDTIIEWKRRFSSKWISTGIPFVQDISPGFDARIVFPGPHIFGNTNSWREAQSELIVRLKCQGVTFSAWNGYTEGYAGVPTTEYGDATYQWARDVFTSFIVDSVHPIPGMIEAEDYEQMFGVEMGIADDDGWGFYIGWLDDGDWLDYEVIAPVDNEYTLRLRIAKPDNGLWAEGQIRAGNTVLTSFNVPGTGGWQSWRTIETSIRLQAGKQTLRLYIPNGLWSINWLELRGQTDREFHELPGRIEAEDYEDMVGVKTQIVLDEDPGFNAGWFDFGDWLDYLIEVKEEGSYKVTLRVALADGFSNGAGQLRIGNDVLWAFSVPATGGWQSWETITGAVNLKAGVQRLRVYVQTGLWNLNWLEFTRESRTRTSR